MISAADSVAISKVLVDRFANIRLPRILTIKERVEIGQKLDEVDIDFLEQVLRDAQENEHLVEAVPECRELFTRVVDLYHGIMTKALENEVQN